MHRNQFFTLTKTNICLLTIFLICLSCSTNEDLQPMELRKPSAMNMSCHDSPAVALNRVEYEYNDGNLVTETTLVNSDINGQTFYTYNSDNQLIFEAYQTNYLKLEKNYIYNEVKQLINVKHKTTNYDSNGQMIDEVERNAPREYKDGLLVKEWEDWGGFNTYTYKNGKVASKIDHTKAGDSHHTTHYKYTGELLIEEKKENGDGGLIYHKTYQYDSQNRLVVTRDGKNTIEEHDYRGNQLLEKRTYYFGIDPRYYFCHGNFIFRYGY